MIDLHSYTKRSVWVCHSQKSCNCSSIMFYFCVRSEWCSAHIWRPTFTRTGTGGTRQMFISLSLTHSRSLSHSLSHTQTHTHRHTHTHPLCGLWVTAAVCGGFLSENHRPGGETVQCERPGWITASWKQEPGEDRLDSTCTWFTLWVPSKDIQNYSSACYLGVWCLVTWCLCIRFLGTGICRTTPHIWRLSLCELWTCVNKPIYQWNHL